MLPSIIRLPPIRDLALGYFVFDIDLQAGQICTERKRPVRAPE
jgi:hypothetical protein